VLFANNPIYRGETIGSYFMVFNSLLSFDSLGVNRQGNGGGRAGGGGGQ
jgi:hypothetical protein